MNSESPLQQAEHHSRLGLPVESTSKHRLIKRVVLKLTWFVTRRQMDFNLATVRTLEELQTRVGAVEAREAQVATLEELQHRVADVERKVTLHRHHVGQVLAGIEASLRAEILGSDRRGDQLETDLIRLSAAVVAVEAQLESMAADVAEFSPAVADTDVAGVRALPSQAHG